MQTGMKAFGKRYQAWANKDEDNSAAEDVDDIDMNDDYEEAEEGDEDLMDLD